MHTQRRVGLMISRMGERGHPESGREEAGGADGRARSGFAGCWTSRLREWLPCVFAARLLAGVSQPDGWMVEENDRLVHLFPIPATQMVPDELRAYCGLVIRPDQAELVKIGTGMPCAACVMAAPNPD